MENKYLNQMAYAKLNQKYPLAPHMNSILVVDVELNALQELKKREEE